MTGSKKHMKYSRSGSKKHMKYSRSGLKKHMKYSRSGSGYDTKTLVPANDLLKILGLAGFIANF